MKTIEDIINKDTQLLITEYNANTKLNSFLAKHEDCDELFKQFVTKAGGYEGRFTLVRRCNQIERELITYVHDNFHGIKCRVKTPKGEIDGIIQHDKYRMFEGRKVDYTVSFRRRFEDANYSEPETIALWVDTMDRFTTHLYPISQIFVNL